LTDEGRALHERTRGPLADIAEAGEVVTLGASVPRGRLRVSAPLVLAHVALARVAARFARSFPEVQLEIVAEDRKADPVEDGFDLVIRVNPSPDERLVGRRILDDQRVVVAHPEFALPKRRAKDANAPEVKAVLPSRTAPDLLWRYRAPRGGAETTVRPVPALRLSSLLMAREAVLTGAGAALLPGLLVADDLRTGRLALWGMDTGPVVEIWALRNSRGLVGAKVRAFLDALDEAFPDRVLAGATAEPE
jgi:DNA-binding transcriptional LysR family regulator